MFGRLPREDVMMARMRTYALDAQTGRTTIAAVYCEGDAIGAGQETSQALRRYRRQ